MTEPWVLADVTRVVRALTAGAVLVIGGWVVASGSDRWSTQQAALAVGVAGVALTGVGVATWLLAGSRRVRVRQQAFEARVRGLVPAETRRVEASDSGALVAGPAMTRFHRPDCELVVGKAVSATTRRQHERAGRTPCGMCGP